MKKPFITSQRLPNLINVGYGSDFTINEYYQIVSEVIGYDGSFHHDLSKPVGMKRKLSQTEKNGPVKLDSKTPLKTGVELTYQAFLNGEQQEVGTKNEQLPFSVV